ncbi:MAG: AgmX/PglI C-terminal domain-containing protein [Myxococcales bacterium]|nr:AgmX/PglI C-terminal domain-containing protein [Myxococcales bacterium]MCB9716980.1 AgmX/PglI C-terminal domain-containing protein [Myxococcales bacterium]
MWGGLTGTEVGEAYGVGGLGLVGTGRGTPEPEYEVKTGAAVLWPDGGAAGQVTADHRFAVAPRDQDGHSCFDVALSGKDSPSVTLCFAPADVREVEGSAVAAFGGGGGIGALGSTGLIGRGGGGGTGSGYGVGTSPGFGGRGKKVPSVRQATATVKGALDKDIIRRIVRAHINEVRYCYNLGLIHDPALEGKLSILFTIGPSGSVPVSTVDSDTLGDGGKVANCVAKAVKRWKFPKPAGGGNVVVTYPFVLAPG